MQFPSQVTVLVRDLKLDKLEKTLRKVAIRQKGQAAMIFLLCAGFVATQGRINLLEDRIIDLEASRCE